MLGTGAALTYAFFGDVSRDGLIRYVRWIGKHGERDGYGSCRAVGGQALRLVLIARSHATDQVSRKIAFVRQIVNQLQRRSRSRARTVAHHHADEP